MTPPAAPRLTERPEWSVLERLRDQTGQAHLRRLFADDPHRAERMTHAVGDLTVDLSKQRVTDEVIDALLALASATGVEERIAEMLDGHRVNTTEDRAVLHTALRAPRGSVILVDGRDVVADVHAVLDHMGTVADRVRAGRWAGHDGRPVQTVVNIGIGGSDLGPAMATRALAAHASIDCRFVSNVDAADLTRTLADLDPATTLFIVASKTFTTAETLANATTAREWVLASADGDPASVARHFIAVSTNAEAVTQFGIDPDNMLGFWEWVGGRYSLCSAIGLSLMIAIGRDGFEEMLRGFRTVDAHLRATPPAKNVPLLMAMVGIWNRNLLDMATLAVLPYSHDLARFPAYLQQLDMESNGKRVTLDGIGVEVGTGPIVWGEPGTNGQHAFYQLLHQGTTTVPCDLIGVLRPDSDLPEDRARSHDDQLVANLIAQGEALAFGRTEEEARAEGMAEALVPHRTFPGNVPTTTVTMERLTPSTLGQLIALYEHKVAIQAAVWGINAFDQWGVELGKALAGRVLEEVASDAPLTHDPSTNALIRRYRAARRG